MNKTFVLKRPVVYLCILLLFSCSQKIQRGPILYSPSESSAQHTISESTFFTLVEGKYELVELDINPEAKQGKDQMFQDMFKTLRYPASARKKGIQGRVYFELSINEHAEAPLIGCLQN